MNRPSVLGYVMARDEWPMLALAVTHVLSNHADHVLVLDHASGDGTREGLERLEREWPGRLSIYRLDDPGFLQEAATTVMAQVGGFAAHDWVYVFDADEFLLTPSGLGLREVLADVPPEAVAVRYEVHNWVAPYSFDETDLNRLPEIRHRARPNVFLELCGEILADEIEHGYMNFFDVPFGSKVIVRGSHSTWIHAGAHLLKHPRGAREVSLPPSRIRAGHVPMLSRSRLFRKARQGQAHIDAGQLPGHGWQNQMLRRMEKAGRLEVFWATHSIADAHHSVGPVAPTVEPDDTLANALGPSLHLLSGQAESDVVASSVEPTATSHVPVGAAVQAVRSAQVVCDAAVADRDAAVVQMDTARAERDAAVADRDAAVVQMDAARAERDAAVADRDAAVAERDAAVVQRDVAVVQMDAARAERDAAVAERDVAVAERSAMAASRTWRWTAWYRRLRAMWRAQLGQGSR